MLVFCLCVVIVRPETLLRWHRVGFRCYWRWKSRRLRGRPQIETELRAETGTVEVLLSKGNPVRRIYSIERLQIAEGAVDTSRVASDWCCAATARAWLSAERFLRSTSGYVAPRIPLYKVTAGERALTGAR
jgi:hypothetical protein